MYKPCCNEPLLLVNQYALTLLQNGANLWIDGERVPCDVMMVNYLPLQHWLKIARHAGDGYVAGSVVRHGTIEEPFFQYVPCGHCEFCRHSKHVDLINRATLESATWSCPPIAITLTYRNDDLPCVKVGSKRLAIGELRYKDIQDFMKRLRMNWTRQGIKHDVRYLVAGEYGSRNGRPHWHMILFNNPYQCDELSPLFQKLKLEVFNAWNKCEWNAFDFRQCMGGAAQYATKYVCKPMNLHGHITKPMIRCSSGSRGGLGAIFVDKLAKHLRENPQQNYLEFVDNKGNYRYMYYTKSISRRLYPSPSSQVPARLKEYYRQFVDVITLLCSVGGITAYDAYNFCELLRPSPHVRNTFTKPQLHPCREHWRKFYVQRFGDCLRDLADELAVVHYDDDEFIQLYYTHRSLLTELDNSPNAQKSAKIREDISKLLAKETL